LLSPKLQLTAEWLIFIKRFLLLLKQSVKEPLFKKKDRMRFINPLISYKSKLSPKKELQYQGDLTTTSN
jgi:hypothetical protein